MNRKEIESGRISMDAFTFELGEILPMHNHEAGGVHMSVATKGSFQVTGPGWEMTISAGDIIDWSPEQYHEFKALEPNSKLINIRK